MDGLVVPFALRIGDGTVQLVAPAGGKMVVLEMTPAEARALGVGLQATASRVDGAKRPATPADVVATAEQMIAEADKTPASLLGTVSAPEPIPVAPGPDATIYERCDYSVTVRGQEGTAQFYERVTAEDRAHREAHRHDISRRDSADHEDRVETLFDVDPEGRA